MGNHTMSQNQIQPRNGVDESFDSSVRWLIVRNFPRDNGGWQPIRVFDLYPLTLRPGRRFYDIAHNGVRFAPGKDLAALRAEAGEAFEMIKLRLLNADGLLAEAARDLLSTGATVEVRLAPDANDSGASAPPV
jgi:hypothetical protein